MINLKTMARRKKDISQTASNEDQELVKLILEKNDEKAFRTLEKKYSKIIAGLIRRMVKDEDDVADLVQETFIKVYNSIKSYKFEYSFAAWIYRIASNNCIDFIRRKKFHFIPIQTDNKKFDDEQFIEIEDTDKTPDDKIIEKEQQEILQKAIEDLPEKYREIIKLRHYEELDYLEIAKKLNMPLGTVKATLFRARKILQLNLKRYKSVLLHK